MHTSYHINYIKLIRNKKNYIKMKVQHQTNAPLSPTCPPSLKHRLITSFFAWDNDNWCCFTVVEAILTDTSLQHTLNKASTTCAKNDGCWLQSLCFSANNLSSIPFNNPCLGMDQ